MATQNVVFGVLEVEKKKVEMLDGKNKLWITC